MNVLELCDPEAAAVPIEASVADAIKKMLDFHVGAVAIVDNEVSRAGHSRFEHGDCRRFDLCVSCRI